MYDEYNDEEIVLSKEEMRMIQRIRQGAPVAALLWECREAGYLLWVLWTCCCMAAARARCCPAALAAVCLLPSGAAASLCAAASPLRCCCRLMVYSLGCCVFLRLPPAAGQFPHVEVNPYEPEVDWFTRDVEVSCTSEGHPYCPWHTCWMPCG